MKIIEAEQEKNAEARLDVVKIVDNKRYECEKEGRKLNRNEASEKKRERGRRHKMKIIKVKRKGEEAKKSDDIGR